MFPSVPDASSTHHGSHAPPSTPALAAGRSPPFTSASAPSYPVAGRAPPSSPVGPRPPLWAARVHPPHPSPRSSSSPRIPLLPPKPWPRSASSAHARARIRPWHPSDGARTPSTASTCSVLVAAVAVKRVGPLVSGSIGEKKASSELDGDGDEPPLLLSPSVVCNCPLLSMSCWLVATALPRWNSCSTRLR
uniref:Uncharacterized protein n=1 Tax=Leersia perrieri TaxID=77586 RepID=A0A0D9UZQ1_9ORYZ